MSPEKGTTRQAQNLAMGRAGIFRVCPVTEHPEGQNHLLCYLLCNSIFKRKIVKNCDFFFPFLFFFLFLFLLKKAILCKMEGPFFSRNVPEQRSLSWELYCCSCPWTKGKWDKETFLVPGKRDNETRKLFCPRTKGQRDVLSWIVLSLGNPT